MLYVEMVVGRASLLKSQKMF